jgi:hypothetical protein
MECEDMAWIRVAQARYSGKLDKIIFFFYKMLEFHLLLSNY